MTDKQFIQSHPIIFEKAMKLPALPRLQMDVWSSVEPQTSGKRQVLFDFRGSGEAELNLRTGQLVFLLRQVNTDWLEGTVDEQTGIFPQSFVKIIKPLPPSDWDAEGGPAYSCLRCFLLRPDSTEARDVCVQEDLGSQPTYKELLFRMRTVFQEEDIALNYRDQDGDLVRLLDDEDVLLMIRQSRIQPNIKSRPVNQFYWEVHVSLSPDLSVYRQEREYTCT